MTYKVKMENLINLEGLLLKTYHEKKFKMPFNIAYRMRKVLDYIGDITSYMFKMQEEYFKQEHDLDKLTTYHDSVVNAEIDIEMGEIISFIEAYEGEMDEDGEFKKNIDKIKFW